MSDCDVCWFDDKPCNMHVSPDGKRSCLSRSSRGVLLYACVRIRFRGMNSVWERGFGMTIREKLERQGLVDFVDEMNRRWVKKRKRESQEAGPE